jgi:hypothetical protein
MLGALFGVRNAWSAKLAFRMPCELYELYNVPYLKWEVLD